MTTILSIGTTHPWNVAGVGSDIRIGTELGARVVSVITAVSAQDAQGLKALERLPDEILRAQFDALPREHVGAVRVGALTSVSHVRVVAQMLRELYDVPVVVDPVRGPSGGGSFADDATYDALKREIGTLPNVVLTPNLAEASALLGGREIDRDSIGDAARTLLDLGARGILVTGGHLGGNPVDALASRETIELFSGTRLPGDMRGTGCTLAMALAVELADGSNLRSAVVHARAFVREKINAAGQVASAAMPY